MCRNDTSHHASVTHVSYLANQKRSGERHLLRPSSVTLGINSLLFHFLTFIILHLTTLNQKTKGKKKSIVERFDLNHILGHSRPVSHSEGIFFFFLVLYYAYGKKNFLALWILVTVVPAVATGKSQFAAVLLFSNPVLTMHPQENNRVLKE